MANKLRDLVAPGSLASVMSAQNPLSARLAALAGFDGVWASGFELSAAYGVPDASLLSLTQHLDMTRAIAERVSVPVTADLDTGYGNAVNVMHVVGAYARARVAAVVIEDKTFPKDTSLLAGGRQDLVRVKELQGKVAAARATGSERDLLGIAHTEALIADLGLEEALKRAHAYAEADMILVHSKQKTPEEIVAFARRWLTAHPRPRREAVNAQVRLNSGANCRLIVARPPETSKRLWHSTLTGWSVNEWLEPPINALAPTPGPTAAPAVARVAAGKRTRPRKGCGRDHIPQRLVTGRITYIDTELGDAADILLGGPAGPEKVQLNGRDDPTWHHLITWIVELRVRSYRTRYRRWRGKPGQL